MKTVMLLRHGKSDWATGTGEDRGRRLAKRGEKAARTMGLLLRGRVPDAALTSPAVRAHTTLDLAMEAGGWKCPVEVTEALYGAEPEDVLAAVNRLDDEIGTVLLVGHEPAWSKTVALLVGGGRHRVPTGALAGIDFDVERWREVRAGAGRLAFLVPPRLVG